MDYQELLNEFQSQTGFDLASQVDDGSDEIDKPRRTLARQHILLQSFIKKHNIYFDYEKLSDKRKKEYREVLIEQVLYSLENEDLSTWNGIDGSNVIDEKTLSDRQIGFFVKDLLYAKGFLSRAAL